MKKGIVAVLAAALLTACAATGENERLYWETPAYAKYPPTGPAKAKGIIFWSHGVSGKRVAWKGPPARFMIDFARDGWDVVKINRNNLNESGWIASGGQHVAHLVSVAKKAKSDGYRHIIAAGQSYGGAISLEADAERDLFFGVIATAPGHGSDACGRGISPYRKADTLTGQLVEAIDRMKPTRVLLTMAKDDECMEFNKPARQLRKALLRSKNPFVFMDDTMPIHGHFAAQYEQFRAWYGRCILRFFDPETEPAHNENTCGAPSPVPRYLLPGNFQVPAPTPGEKSLVGAWSGTYNIERNQFSDTRDVCLFVQNELRDGLVTKLAYGPGERLKLNMSTVNRYFKKDRSAYAYSGRKNFRIILTPNPDFSEIGMHVTSVSGTGQWSTTLKRGCRLYR